MKVFFFGVLVNIAVYIALGGGWHASVAAICAQLAAHILWDHIEGDAE